MEPDALLERLGRTVRSLRSERGLSMKDLAADAELSIRFVSDVEAGRGNVSVRGLARLARALEVPVGSLLSDADAP